MSPQLQQVLAEIDQLSSTKQIQFIEHLNTRQRSSVLETIANLRSQQSSFKTLEEIDAEILEEKEAFKTYDIPTPYDSFGTQGERTKIGCNSIERN